MPRFGPIVAVSCLALLPLRLPAQTMIWDAGQDMVLNEGSALTETQNPNAVVPEWSYGWRGTLAGTALTLFPASDHLNQANLLDGFAHTSGNGPYLFVNTGPGNVTSGALSPIAPGEILIDPSFSNQFTIARWTAPYAGTFSVTADWRDLDPNGGNGASADLVLNGTSIFNVNMVNGGSASLGTIYLTLAAGDVLDFTVGTLGEPTYDSTGLTATITAVPEPSSWALMALGLVAVFCRRRRA